MTTKQRNNEEAQQAYFARYAEINSLLAGIGQAVEDMHAPDETTHWGHVGDLSEIAKMLRQVSDRIS